MRDMFSCHSSVNAAVWQPANGDASKRPSQSCDRASYWCSNTEGRSDVLTAKYYIISFAVRTEPLAHER